MTVVSPTPSRSAGSEITYASTDLSQYDALVLQGGGARCFYTLGFLEVAGHALTGLRQIVAVSAATAMACAHLSGSHHLALELFAARVRENPRNFYWSRALRGQRPTPHLDMYRGTMSEILTPARFAQIRDHAQKLRIVVARGPSRSKLLIVGLAACTVLRPRPAPFLQAHVLRVADMQHPSELVDAVMASSSFPPFTPVPTLPDGTAIIDGGAVAPVPISGLLGAQRPLVLLTRPTPRLPIPPGFPLVGPREPLPMQTWEYTNEPGLRVVYDAGRRDGEAFLRSGTGRIS